MKSNLLFVCAILILSACQRHTTNHYTSEKMQKMGLPFSEAVIVGDLIYLSGQIGNIPGEMKVVEGGIGPETRQAMKNIENVLVANESSLKDIIKCTIMMEDISEWSDFNKEYVTFFPDQKPARSAFGTDGLALGAKVEIECIACRQEN